MTKLTSDPESHAFSIELKHKKYLKTVGIPTNCQGMVLIEGFLGKLSSVSFVESLLLEIHGENGVLRIDMKAEEVSQVANGGKGVKQ